MPHPRRRWRRWPFYFFFRRTGFFFASGVPAQKKPKRKITFNREIGQCAARTHAKALLRSVSRRLATLWLFFPHCFGLSAIHENFEPIAAAGLAPCFARPPACCTLRRLFPFSPFHSTFNNQIIKNKREGPSTTLAVSRPRRRFPSCFLPSPPTPLLPPPL